MSSVFLNNISALNEIGADLAFYFDNFSEEYMANLVKHHLEEFNNNAKHEAHRLASHAGSFEWKKCIQNYLQLYVETLNI